MMVRDFNSIVGKECVEQMPRCGRQPDAVLACVGGGSNAMGIFHRVHPDESVKLIGVEAGGLASRPASTRRRCRRHAGRAARQPHLPAAGRDGQIIETHSISAGLDYPGVGPSTRGSRTRAAPSTCRHRRRGAAGLPHALPHEGIIPALESSHALAYAMKIAPDDGQGQDPAREPLGPRRQGHAHRRQGLGAQLVSRIAATFEKLRAQARRADPFVTAGDPAPDARVPIMQALVAAART
jgi:tryptophan synthase beta subunit